MKNSIKLAFILLGLMIAFASCAKEEKLVPEQKIEKKAGDPPKDKPRNYGDLTNDGVPKP